MATPTNLFDDHALRGIIERALETRKRARTLRTFPLCAPLPGQARIFEYCVRQAERSGLVLPPKIVLEWRAGGRDHEHGETSVTFDVASDRMLGDLVIAMNADQWPELLAETAFHELKHASDLADHVLRHLNPVESEVRACIFAAEMMGRRG